MAPDIICIQGDDSHRIWFPKTNQPAQQHFKVPAALVFYLHHPKVTNISISPQFQWREGLQIFWDARSQHTTHTKPTLPPNGRLITRSASIESPLPHRIPANHALSPPAPKLRLKSAAFCAGASSLHNRRSAASLLDQQIYRLFAQITFWITDATCQ